MGKAGQESGKGTGKVSPVSRRLLDAIPMATLFLGSDLRIRAANGELQALFSSGEAMLNRPISEFVSDDAFLDQVEELLRYDGGKCERKLRLDNGTDLRAVMMRVRASSLDGVIILMEELSDRIWLEDNFLQAEKLFAMGQLATCITHEIGNPLGIMKSNMLFLNDSLAKLDDELTVYSQLVIENIDRMHELLKDIAEFSRPRKEQSVFHDIRTSLSQTLHFIEKECEGHGVVIEKTFEDTLPLICCNPQRLKQVFLNLFKNSIEAMPAGGRLSVTAERVAMNQEGKDSVLVKVADTGVGISEEELRRIFKPFHTTKGNGNGLGLFIVRNIVREHNGRIEVNSRKCAGTTVSLLLPVDGRKYENA